VKVLGNGASGHVPDHGSGVAVHLLLSYPT
jgi:hypothetical protein